MSSVCNCKRLSRQGCSIRFICLQYVQRHMTESIGTLFCSVCFMCFLTGMFRQHCSCLNWLRNILDRDTLSRYSRPTLYVQEFLPMYVVEYHCYLKKITVQLSNPQNYLLTSCNSLFLGSCQCVEPTVEQQHERGDAGGAKQGNWFSLAALAVFAEMYFQVQKGLEDGI